jgi:hypothetical protein
VEETNNKLNQLLSGLLNETQDKNVTNNCVNESKQYHANLFVDPVITLKVGDEVDKELDMQKKLHERGFAGIVNQHPWPSWVDESRVKRIRALNCFPLVHDYILNRVPTDQIARYIQLHGEMTKLGIATIRQYVEHYKATVPKMLMMRSMGANISVRKIEKKAERVLNIMDELNWLYNFQKKRLEKAKGEEDKLPFMNAKMHHDVKQAREILQSAYTVMKDLGITGAEREEDAKGVIDTAEKLIDSMNLGKLYSNERITDTIKDPQSRMKIMRAVEVAVTMIDKREQYQEEEKRAKQFEGFDDIESSHRDIIDVTAQAPDDDPMTEDPLEGYEKVEDIDVDLGAHE